MRRHLPRGDAGFTLTELAIVVVIISVLTAIAIPIFLHQRESAWNATVKSDLTHTWTAAEAARTDVGSASGVAAADIKIVEPITQGNTIEVHVVGEAFCMVGTHGTDPGTWIRDESGLHAGSPGDCGGTVLVTLH